MICFQCNTDNASVLLHDRVYREDNEILIVEQVPSISCRKCGQIFYNTKTLTHLERIQANKEKLASDRTVKIVDFNTIVDLS